jgi:hypothetical protein
MTQRELILSLMTKIAEKKSAIESAKKPNWNTSCVVNEDSLFGIGRGSDVNSNINIMTVRDAGTLLSIIGRIVAKKREFDLGVEFTKYNNPPEFRYEGYMLTDWISDIKTRLGQIDIVASQLQVEGWEKQLKSITERLAPEILAEIELGSLEAELDS